MISHRKIRAVCFASIASSAACFAPPTKAQGRAENAATAEALFRDARNLMREAKYADACPKFEASQRLDPALGTLLNLADCHEKAGVTASAWAEFLEAAAEAHRNGETERESVARDRATKIEARLTKLSVILHDPARVEGLVIERDGRALDAATWGMAAPVDPGSHTIVVRAPGKKTWQATVVANEPGRTFTVDVPPLETDNTPQPIATEQAATEQSAPSTAPASGLTSTAPRDPVSGGKDGSTQRTVGILVGGVGLAGLAVGTALGLSARSSWEGAECPNNVCATPGDKGQADHAKERADWATVAFGIGGAAVVTGVVVFLTAPHNEPAASAALVVDWSPQRRGVSLAGQF